MAAQNEKESGLRKCAAENCERSTSEDELLCVVHFEDPDALEALARSLFEHAGELRRYGGG